MSNKQNTAGIWTPSRQPWGVFGLLTRLYKDRISAYFSQKKKPQTGETAKLQDLLSEASPEPSPNVQTELNPKEKEITHLAASPPILGQFCRIALFQRSTFKSSHHKLLFGARERKEKVKKRSKRWEDLGGEDRKRQPHAADCLWHQWLEVAEGGGGQKGSGWEGVNPLCIKLERFIIYHYAKPEIYTQLSLPPPPRTNSKNITRGGAKHQSASSRQWAKLICKYIQEIKKLNYTGKWGSYTWIVRIMNNYCELPAPNITVFFIYIYIFFFFFSFFFFFFYKQRLNYRVVLENFRGAH